MSKLKNTDPHRHKQQPAASSSSRQMFGFIENLQRRGGRSREQLAAGWWGAGPGRGEPGWWRAGPGRGAEGGPEDLLSAEWPELRCQHGGGSLGTSVQFILGLTQGLYHIIIRCGYYSVGISLIPIHDMGLLTSQEKGKIFRSGSSWPTFGFYMESKNASIHQINF